jgi:LmbE family N-acetylglucosaminyl deacetylase
MKILVIAPHPDDEVLGCGGTIKKHIRSGNDVYLCVVTEAYQPDWTEKYIKNKEREIRASNKFIGFKKSFFLGLPTVKLDIIGQKKINDLIYECVKKINPEIVYIPFFGDINKDHQIVSQACMVAVRPKPGSKIKKVFLYEVSSETEWAKPAQKIEDVFMPNHYEDISIFLNSKLNAMKCYKSELKKYPHPRSLEGIKILAQKRGMESGLKYAEAFMSLREINS